MSKAPQISPVKAVIGFAGFAECLLARDHKQGKHGGTNGLCALCLLRLLVSLLSG